ncbi:hypothetical protein PLESTF_000382300 [Pleodorina starrii]|nr:hypothetical protein PLESTF_000382300 [Pleodorina starrii]
MDVDPPEHVQHALGGHQPPAQPSPPAAVPERPQPAPAPGPGAAAGAPPASSRPAAAAASADSSENGEASPPPDWEPPPQAASSPTDDPPSPSLDFLSPSFDALRALHTPGLRPPLPAVRPLDNVSVCRRLLPPDLPESITLEQIKAKEEAHKKHLRFKESALRLRERIHSGTTHSLDRVLSAAAAASPGPLDTLRRWRDAAARVCVTTRHACGVRGRATGELTAYDRLMNIVLRDVAESYTVPVRRVKEYKALVPAAAPPSDAVGVGSSSSDGGGGGMVEVTRTRIVRRREVRHRQLGQVFIKGDNVVAVHLAPAEEDGEVVGTGDTAVRIDAAGASMTPSPAPGFGTGAPQGPGPGSGLVRGSGGGLGMRPTAGVAGRQESPMPPAQPPQVPPPHAPAAGPGMGVVLLVPMAAVAAPVAAEVAAVSGARAGAAAGPAAVGPGVRPDWQAGAGAGGCGDAVHWGGRGWGPQARVWHRRRATERPPGWVRDPGRGQAARGVRGE